jgi:DNA mismatch repair protein MutH
MENRMIDSTANEKKAMEMSSERAGEYIEWLKKTDMETFTRKEWSDFIEVIVTGYLEGMSKMADDDVPF